MSLILKPTAEIKAKAIINEEETTLSIKGVTSGQTTETNARTQINKLLSVVGQSVEAAGMKRVLTEESNL